MDTHAPFHGNPNGLVRPDYPGQLLSDTATPAVWQAGSYDSSSWTQVSGGGGGAAGIPFGRKTLTTAVITRTPFTWAAGDTNKVLYTCPAGKQALGLDINLSNGQDLLRGVEQVMGPVPYGVTGGGTMIATFFWNAVDLGDINAGGNPAADTTVSFQPVALSAGDTFGVTVPAGDLAIAEGLLVMLEADPAETGVVCVHGATPVVANTVVYTVPAGKTAIMLGGPSAVNFFGRTVAATPATHLHVRYTPAGLTAINIDPGGFFEGSLAGGSDGPQTTSANNLMGIWGPGDTIELWQDNTGFQTHYSFMVQEA